MFSKTVSIRGSRALFGMMAGLVLAPLGAGCAAETADTGEEAQELAGQGTLYRVGPGRAHKDLGAVADLLAPGDVVEVDGDATYPGGVRFEQHGTASAPITIRGVAGPSGKLPVISGGKSTVELAGDHYVFEGFEVTGGSTRCVFHRAHEVTVRDSVVQGCPGHGILSADQGSGSLTLERVEVYASGSGATRHPVYVATDETAHPGSVFRMRHCYIHDGNGGNNVKSRAERNEIHYNWIENAFYKELELIGPDGQDPSLAREDSEVVGNVFFKGAQSAPTFAVRIGGDGTGDTAGRYRFLNNTFVLGGDAAAIQAFDRIESVELHNNVFYRQGPVRVLRDDASWTSGKPIVEGRSNFVTPGSTVPPAWTSTITDADPGFVDLASGRLDPRPTSVLVNAATPAPPSPSGFPFSGALSSPASEPPLPGDAEGAQRVTIGLPDVGAFEAGVSLP